MTRPLEKPNTSSSNRILITIIVQKARGERLLDLLPYLEQQLRNWKKSQALFWIDTPTSYAIFPSYVPESSHYLAGDYVAQARHWYFTQRTPLQQGIFRTDVGLTLSFEERCQSGVNLSDVVSQLHFWDYIGCLEVCSFLGSFVHSETPDHSRSSLSQTCLLWLLWTIKRLHNTKVRQSLQLCHIATRTLHLAPRIISTCYLPIPSRISLSLPLFCIVQILCSRPAI
jgi:hypothetical protein